MVFGEDSELYRNLLDAGYSEPEAARCLTLAGSGQWAELLRGLSRQKAALLSLLHKSEQQIDCLDYLVYRINKTYRNGGEQNV